MTNLLAPLASESLWNRIYDDILTAILRAERKAAQEEEELEPCEWCGGKEECREGCKVALEGNLTFSEFFCETRGI